MSSGPWLEHLSRRLAALKAAGLERYLRIAEGCGAHVVVGEREVVNFASNDYLGLSADPRVLAAARAALDHSGAGATASRLLGGTKPEHAALEQELARFKRSETALVFASGYHAALASIGAVLDVNGSPVEGNDDVKHAGDEPRSTKTKPDSARGESDAPKALVVLDRLAHASLLDAAKLSGARLRTFKHNDPEDLKRVLEREGVRANGKQSASKDAGPLTLVVVESLYSMDGDVAPLKDLHDLTHASGALLLVDEAHATGVLGCGGRGALTECFHQNLPADVLAMGTLSKALGSQGGYLCCGKLVRDAIVHAGRAFLFSTGLAPASAAAAREALLLAEADEPRRLALLRRADYLRAALREKGWKVLGGPGPIVPILVGGESEAAALAERLLLAGVWAPAVRYPTVKKGQARLRISISAAHADKDIERLLDVLGSK